jgi:hypothetical protein
LVFDVVSGNAGGMLAPSPPFFSVAAKMPPSSFQISGNVFSLSFNPQKGVSDDTGEESSFVFLI